MHTETFSYLPPLNEDQIKAQINYILENNWIPGIEFTDDPSPSNAYWNFWKLPLIQCHTVDDVLEELYACQQKHPQSYIKITGYDNIRQGQVLAFVAYKPKIEKLT